MREVCSAALALRKAAGPWVRLPLPRLTVATPAFARLAPFVALRSGPCDEPQSNSQ